MIQTVLELDLADYPGDRANWYDAYQFERHEHWQISELPPGTYVRLNIHRYRPLSPSDFFRKDLIWQVIGRDAQALTEWRNLLEGAPVAEL